MPKLSTIWLYVAAVAVVSALFLGMWYQHEAIGALKDQAKTSNESLESAKQEIIDIRDDYAKIQERTLDLSDSVNDIVREAAATKSLLQSYAGRENVVIKKPTLIESRVNKASDATFDRLSCTTGACKEKP